MSQQQMTTSTEKYIKSSDGLNNSTKIEKTTKVITTEETTRTQKYKYQFSNTNKTNSQNNFKNNLNQKSSNNKLYETENSTVVINSTNNGKNSQNYAIENSNFNYRYNNKPLTENSNLNTNNKSYISNINYMTKYLTEKSDSGANNIKNSNNILSHNNEIKYTSNYNSENINTNNLNNPNSNNIKVISKYKYSYNSGNSNINNMNQLNNVNNINNSLKYSSENSNFNSHNNTLKYSSDKSNTNSMNTLKHISDNLNTSKNKNNSLKYTIEKNNLNNISNNNAIKYSSGNNKTNGNINNKNNNNTFKHSRNNTNIEENINTYNNNSRNIPRKKISSSGDISDESPSRLKCNCETNYSINNLTNVKYVNGSNKKISQKSYIRVPDIKYKSYKNEEKISEEDVNNIPLEENENNTDKCTCDVNSECTCGKRKYNNEGLYDENKMVSFKLETSEEKDNIIIDNNSNNANDDNLNNKRKFINRNYYVFENEGNNKRNIKNVRYNNDGTINVETIPIIFSDDETNIKTKRITNKKIVKYNSPDNRNNRSIKISKYSKMNNNYNTAKDLRNINRVENIRVNHHINNNHNNDDLCHCTRNYSNSSRKNYRFKSTCNCSDKDIHYNKRYMNTISSQRKDINESSDNSSKRYKYSIKIHNINVSKGMNHSASYENIKNRKSRTNVFSSEEISSNNIERNNQSYDKEDLKMQNAQNMQVIQDEKLMQILVPIPPNTIDYACDLEIYGNRKKKYTLEEINEIRKRKKIIEENEIIRKKKEEDNIKIKNLKVKKTNWNLTNEEIKANKLSYETNIKDKIRNENANKNENKIVDNNKLHEIKIITEKSKEKPKRKIKEKQKEYDIENFNINISDDGRKFRGEMNIEKNKLELEKQVKNPNLNLLSTSNEEIMLNADYPRRDWNSITRPISGRPLSIESNKKKVLLERRVEKLSLEGNSKPKNDWNICNNEKKEVNINLYQKKKRPNLSKERMQPFVISGKENNWNNITTKENESKLTIRGIEKKKTKENEEEVLFNDDYNMIKENHIRPILANIKKVQDVSEESMSSEIDVLKNIKMYNGQFDQYKDMVLDSIRTSGSPHQNVIINDISRKYPKRIETYHGKDEEEESNTVQIINGKINNIENGDNGVIIMQGQSNERPTYSKKIITTYQKNQINKKIISYPKTNILYKLDEDTPQMKYYYREMITSNNNQLNNQNDLINNNNNKNNIYNQNDNNNENQQIETPRSNFVRSYREEIISLSPSRAEDPSDIISNHSFIKPDKNKINENKEYSIKQIKYNYNFNYNDSQAKDTNNQNLNLDNVQKQPNYSSYIEKNEQQIPNITEEEDMNNNFSSNYNEMISEQNEEKPQVQYIFKRGNQSSNSNSNSIKSYKQIINQEKNKEDININISLNQESIQQQQPKQIVYDYNLNFPKQEKEIQKIKGSQIEETPQGNYINMNQSYEVSQSGNNNSSNIINSPNSDSIIINSNRNNNSHINNLIYNYNMQQKQKEISKSQEEQNDSANQTRFQNNYKYASLIQGYSKHLMNNPSDNYNHFGTNKLNIIPMSRDNHYSMIINQENNQNNDISGQNMTLFNSIRRSFPENRGTENSKNIIKVLKY